MPTYEMGPCWETRPHRPHYGPGNYGCNGVWPEEVPTIEELGKQEEIARKKLRDDLTCNCILSGKLAPPGDCPVHKDYKLLIREMDIKEVRDGS